MSSTVYTGNGHRPARIPGPLAESLEPTDQQRALSAPGRALALPVAFTATVLRYLFLIGPAVRRELARWQSASEAIEDPALRASARQALAKRGNIEGAALFATLAPAAHRTSTVRALVAYQCAYNYLDALSELESADPVTNADQLHQALLIALHPDAEHVDYYQYNPQHRDGGYLREMLDACRASLRSLPSFRALAPVARAAAARIVDFQTLNLAEAHGGHEALERWATVCGEGREGLRWWETAAACGSSLPVHALIGSAARSDLDAADARAIDRAYHPSATALHSLLDSLVDRLEDQKAGRRCLLENYDSSVAGALRLGSLAWRARDDMRRLPDPETHRVILTAMCSYYLSAPQSRTAEAERVRSQLAQALGPSLRAAIVMFEAKRLAHQLTNSSYR